MVNRENKTTIDLTIFDNSDILTRYFDTIEALDDYILSKFNLSFDTETSKKSSRNYKGNYHYFNSETKLGEYETFAMLRTYVDKYKQGYGISSYDYGYICPLGWNIIGDQNKYINVIDSPKSHKVMFRKK